MTTGKASGTSAEETSGSTTSTAAWDLSGVTPRASSATVIGLSSVVVRSHAFGLAVAPSTTSGSR